MRYDLNILWVEDTATYYEETKEILETYAEDNGISLKFHYIQDVNVFFEKIKIMRRVLDFMISFS